MEVKQPFTAEYLRSRMPNRERRFLAMMEKISGYAMQASKKGYSGIKIKIPNIFHADWEDCKTSLEVSKFYTSKEFFSSEGDDFSVFIDWDVENTFRYKKEFVIDEIF